MNYTNLATIHNNQIFLFFANTIGTDNTSLSSRSITPKEMEEKRKSLSAIISDKTSPLEFYSPKQVEKKLGISHSTLYKMIRNQELSTFCIGRRRLITSESLAEYIINHEMKGSDYGF